MSRNRIAGIFFILFSSYICIESYHLGIGKWRKPGPGFLTFYAGMILCGLALVIFFDKGKGKGPEGPFPWRGGGLCLLALLAYVLLLNPLGFIPTTFLFIAFVIRFVERKRWVVSIFTALTSALAAYGLFDVCLKSQLPRGIMGLLGL
jgi:putative tricarboxylic transport membrane protein